MTSPKPTVNEVLAANREARANYEAATTRRPRVYRRINVTRDRLEAIAFGARTQIHLDETTGTATTRAGGIEFWASLDEREVW